jgi:coenzyme F420 hydrogenase subunit beta
MMFPYTLGLAPLLDEPLRIAAVGLPCQLDMLRQWERDHPGAKGKIQYRIGLFCSKGASASLVHAFMDRHNIYPGELRRFYFRKGQWKGQIAWDKTNGETRSLPYINFAFYNNLYIHQPALCLGCGDATAEVADISCGDAWLPHLKRSPYGHSLVITRTQDAEELFTTFRDSGAFVAKPLDVQQVLKSQIRTLIKKRYFSIASQKIGPLFGYKVQSRGGLPPRWNHYLGAALVMLSMRLGRSQRISKLVFRLPRWTLYPYMAILKALMSF